MSLGIERSFDLLNTDFGSVHARPENCIIQVSLLGSELEIGPGL